MSDSVTVPVKKHDTYNWAALSSFGADHVICAEKCTLQQENYSFAGGHRVRLYKVKKNVHWRLPQGLAIDIAKVVPARRLPSQH